MHRCLRAVTTRVSEEKNHLLLVEFTSDEVCTAVHQMAQLKAPGLDRFTTSFFQENWATVGTEVCNAVLSILRSGVMNPDLNFTYIALIPKNKNPISVTKFRPISLS